MATRRRYPEPINGSRTYGISKDPAFSALVIATVRSFIASRAFCAFDILGSRDWRQLQTYEGSWQSSRTRALHNGV